MRTGANVHSEQWQFRQNVPQKVDKLMVVSNFCACDECESELAPRSSTDDETMLLRYTVEQNQLQLNWLERQNNENGKIICHLRSYLVLNR